MAVCHGTSDSIINAPYRGDFTMGLEANLEPKSTLPLVARRLQRTEGCCGAPEHNDWCSSA